MKFANIPGLEETKSLLIDSVREEHMEHAQLFTGAEGALNLPLALAYATYLHCQNKGEDACGQCPACSKSLKYIHPDTHFVFPLSNIKGDKDEDQFKAEIMKSWRAFLLEQPFGNPDEWTTYYGGEEKQTQISREAGREIIKALSLKPFESPYKVMIIWQPELLHPSAANGILKIVEEPPPHTYFILVTQAADKLLPTLVSRTQIITVPLLSDPDIKMFLESERNPDSYRDEGKRVDRIAQLAEGNLNLALKLSDNEEDNNTKIFIDWMRACFDKNFSRLVALAEEYHNLDKLGQKNLMQYGINMMRETLLSISGADAIHRVRDEELKFIQNFTKVMTLKKIEKSFSLMNDASYHLERNGSAKMIFLDLSLNLSKTIKPA